MTRIEDVPTSTMKAFPHVFDDPQSIPKSVDPFTITAASGFMPTILPATTLPEVFAPLSSIMDRLPVRKADGTPGLLATYELGDVVHAELPDLTDEIDKIVTPDGKPDLYTLTAIFRDYSFLASSYLLEPCWKSWNTNPDQGYGLGRDRLPHSIAGPMYKSAQMYAAPPCSLQPPCCMYDDVMLTLLTAWIFLHSCLMLPRMLCSTMPLPTPPRDMTTPT